MEGRNFTGDLEALRRLLIDQAFVHSREGRALRDRSGAPVPWLYYGGEINLTYEGAGLAAAAIRERLSPFSATQLATYGMSAVPLLATCIAQAEGSCTGLVIRKEPKTHGVARRIDGPIDRGRPVVVIDESISSGSSIYEAACALEAEGLEVEGAVCVVEFSGYGAREWLTARGYRIETIFDVWRDLEQPGVPPEHAPHVPYAEWSSEQLPPALSPAELVRDAAEKFVRDGRLPRPPERLDRAYDAAGGTFVSIRRKRDDVRIVRAGFRRERNDLVDVGHDIVVATREALRRVPAEELASPDSLKFAVSLLGAPEAITPGEIRHELDALVVRGFGPLERLGVALPNAPHYDDPVEQWRYARTVTAHFWRWEPHALFRQRVERITEPGASWPPYGAPGPPGDWTDDPEFATALATGVRQILHDPSGADGLSEPVSLPHVGEALFGVGISIYADGLAGCAISHLDDLGLALREAGAAALADRRYDDRLSSHALDEYAVVVSMLLRRRWLGRVSRDRLPLFYRVGRDTLQVTAGGSSGLVLAHFAAQQSLDATSYQRQVLAKAGVAHDRGDWIAYETASWLVTGRRGRRLELGFPVRSRMDGADTRQCQALGHDIANFVLGQRTDDGLPAYLFAPWSGARTTAGTATRVLIAISGLLEVGAWLGESVVPHATAMVELFSSGDSVRVPRASLTWDSGSEAQLLNCLSCLEDRDRHTAAAMRLVDRLGTLMRRDGAVYAGQARMSADLDFLSGSALLGLARASEWLPSALDAADLPAVLDFYQRRFRLVHPWGMVWWHGQAWSVLADRVAGATEFVFELADWALAAQNKSSGAFVISDLEPPRLSFLSACVLEAVGEAWALALRRHDLARAARYEMAWTRGISFVERLVIRQDDAFFSNRPRDAIGGVRPTLRESELRIDYAGHALLALAKGLRVRSDVHQLRRSPAATPSADR